MWADEEEAPAWGDEPAATEEAAGGEAGATEAAEGGEQEAKPASAREKAPPPHYTYHWVRPLFLNYRYIYDYRQNYYNDVIDWMNKRQKGLYREEPRAEEWAERALRTYTLNNKNKSTKRSADMRIITKMPHTPRHYSYHTRAYYSLKYQKIL